MSGYIVKTAAGAARCVLDWRAGWLAAGEQLAGAPEWSVFPRRAGERPVIVAEQRRDADRCEAVLRGGERGRFYLVSCRVQTGTGRALARSVVLRIACGPAPELRSPR